MPGEFRDQTLASRAGKLGAAARQDRWFTKENHPAPRPLMISRLKLPLDLREIGYVAGLIDGEGCIHRGKKGLWRVEIGMTDEPTIRWLQGIGGRVYAYAAKGNNKAQWHWTVLAQLEVAELLETVLPILITKRVIAAQAITEIRMR